MICPACGHKAPDDARFCSSCGGPLAAPAPRREERKTISVLFADLVGFTSKSEQLDPEAVRGMLDPYYAQLRRELERHGGTVEKFIGDAVMALFGAPIAHEDDPERAVRAAFAILSSVGALNRADPDLGLHVRIGVNTGEALVVLTARPSEGEAMAAGDVINTAARLQTAAPPDGIVVGEATYRATAHAVEYEALDAQQVKGKALPVAAWKAVATRGLSARRDTSRAPLIGRDTEMRELHDRWARVRGSGRPSIVTLLGTAGIGKSRLLHEFTGGLDTGAVSWGRCLSYGDGITYWPVAEMLRDAVGILHSDDAATITVKVASFVESLGIDLEESPTLTLAMGTLIGSEAAGQLADRISRTELHWAIRRLYELLARRGPIVLVFEDLHWAEPALLDLIRFVADGAQGPLLVLCSSRPELVETQPAFVTGGAVLALKGLTNEQSQSLLSGLLDVELPPVAVERLMRNAGGNPLFLEEMVGMVASAIQRDDARPIVEAVESLSIPATLQSLIEARVDRLPLGEKKTAQHASVVGSVFWSGAVAYLSESREGLDRDLDALTLRDLIQTAQPSSIAGEDEYAFKHILIRDVAYGELPKGRRAALHARAAEWIGELPGAEDRYVEIVAYHLEQSCRLVRDVGRTQVIAPVAAAVQALTRAGERAERHEGFREAEHFYARALDVLGTSEGELRLGLLLRRGLIAKALGELTLAAVELAEVDRLAVVLERPDIRCEALIALANIDNKQGRASDARTRLEEAASMLRTLDAPRLLVQQAFEHSAFQARFGSDPQIAIDNLRRVVPIAETLGDRTLLIEAHMRLGTLLFNAGQLAGAEWELLQSTELAAQVGSFRAQARADALLGLVKYYRGDLVEAERLGLEAHELFERTGDRYMQLQNYHKLARYAIARDDPRLAEQRLREGLPLALEMGGWIIPETYRRLAETLVRQGRVDEAGECAALAAANAPQGDGYARSAVLLADAIVKTARREPMAIERLNDAVRMLEEQQLAVDLGEARIALARGLRVFGDGRRAREELERARETFVRMEAQGVVDEIDRDIAALAKGPEPSGPFAAATPS